MYDSGNVEIFSHSKRHVFYNRLPVRSLRDDVQKSYREIERHLGKIDLKVLHILMVHIQKKVDGC